MHLSINKKTKLSRSEKVAHFFNFLAWLSISFTFYIFTSDIQYIEIDGVRYLHSADDQMITMRVAQNIANYGLPYFNIDEAVAANTSLFWPFILSLLFIATESPERAVALSMVISIIMTSSSIFVATLFVKKAIFKIAIAVFLIASPTFLNFGYTGWEHIPQTLFITLSLYYIHRSSDEHLHIPLKSLYLLALAFAMRPDSAPIIAVVVLTWIISERRFKFFKNYLQILGLTIAPIAYVSLMIYYYGDWRPNTAHLKSLDLITSLEFGLYYLINPNRSGVFLVFVTILAFLKGRSDFGRLFLAISLSQTAYVVLMGGDVFAGGRFFMMLLPVAVATVARELESTRFETTATRLLPFSSLAIIFTFWSGPLILRQPFQEQTTADSAIVEQIRIAHRTAQEFDPRDGSIGLHFLGIAFHVPSFHVVDFLGKAEPYIARSPIQIGPPGHNRWDYEYAFSRYNIAIVPMMSSTVDTVLDPNFSLARRDWMFWEEASLTAITSGDYTFVPPEAFGNAEFGAFVRNDLVDRLQW